MLGRFFSEAKNTFRTLRGRNYRLYFIGQGLSLVGTWMQMIAVGWLVYRLTNSPVMLGVVGFSGQIFTFALAPFAGVAADRFDRKGTLLLTQSLSLIQALILSALVLTGLIHVWHLVILSAILGIINAFDIPIRQSFVVEMVDRKEDLGNAIALNSSMVNLARLLGPSIAGILIAVAGEGPVFLVNAISYLSVIVSLLLMNIKAKKMPEKRPRFFKEFIEGLKYAVDDMPIRSSLLLLSLASLVGMPYTILMPIFARDILKGGPETLGFLMASSGLGALLGGLFLASKRTVLGLERTMAMASFIFGAGLVVFAFSNSMWLSMATLFISGFGMLVNMASSNTILQTVVDDDKRGRIMSLFTMSFMGMAPFGSLYAGFVSNHLSPQSAVMIGGVGCILGAFLFSLGIPEFKQKVHHRYRKAGIIKEVAVGIQAATELSRPPEER